MYTLLEQNGRTAQGVKQYVCDTEEDLVAIARHCDLGDCVLVLETDTVYMMNSKREWKEI